MSNERSNERSDLPRTATRLAAAAEQAGWDVAHTHNAEHDSHALRLRRGNQRAAAVWANGKFLGAWTLGRLHEPATGRSWPMPHRLSARDVVKHVREEL